MREMCSKIKIKTREQRRWHASGFFLVILNLFHSQKVNACWEYLVIITVQNFQRSNWSNEGSVIKLLILIRCYGKQTLRSTEISNANTTLVALFEICFRSLSFDVEKRRQCSEVKAIAWFLVQLTINLTRGNLRSYIFAKFGAP